MTNRLFAALNRLDQCLTRHGRLLGALLAALLAGALELTPYKGLNAPYSLYAIPE